MRSDAAPPWLPLAWAALPLAAWLALLLVAAVDVPYIDDFDAVLAFLDGFLGSGSTAASLQQLFSRHNEHVMLTLRATALASWALTGGVDFRVLDLLGSLFLVALVAALHAMYRPDAPPRERWLGFAPAVFLLVHPQYWTILLSSTTSLSTFAMAAFAAVCLAALERRSRSAFALAVAAGAAATFSLANGGLVWPVGALQLWVQRRRALALLWCGAALPVVAGFVLAAAGGDRPTLYALDRPLWLARYALLFLGNAGGFSQHATSLVVGAALVASAVALVARGLPRRSPALFGVLAFLLLSVLANALLRAHQGPGVALGQPRYRFFGALALAATYLAWLSVLSGRAARRWRSVALPVSALFCAASFALYAAEPLRLGAALAQGYEHWWTRGDGGLYHPNFRTANHYLLRSLDTGRLAVPAAWVEEHGSDPHARDAPEADSRVKLHVDALHAGDDAILVAGWAYSGASAQEQEVEILLAREGGALGFPALRVARADLPLDRPALLRRLGRSGFHALLRIRDVPPGPWRVGIAVRRPGDERVAWSRLVEVPRYGSSR